MKAFQTLRTLTSLTQPSVTKSTRRLISTNDTASTSVHNSWMWVMGLVGAGGLGYYLLYKQGSNPARRAKEQHEADKYRDKYEEQRKDFFDPSRADYERMNAAKEMPKMKAQEIYHEMKK